MKFQFNTGNTFRNRLDMNDQLNLLSCQDTYNCMSKTIYEMINFNGIIITWILHLNEWSYKA